MNLKELIQMDERDPRPPVLQNVGQEAQTENFELNQILLLFCRLKKDGWTGHHVKRLKRTSHTENARPRWIHWRILLHV